MFGTKKSIKYLCDSTYWILDGTFKIAPNIFYQLFTIHCNVAPTGNKIFPMVYCLMSGKSAAHYDKLFKVIPDYLIVRISTTISGPLGTY